MLGYRHIFHAGNHADILKHAVLTLTLQALLRKDKPFVYIDTHAGPGRYALDDVRALRTGEFQDGIGRWWPPAASVPSLAPLLSLVHDLNPEGTLRHYPGSPLIAQRLLRPADRMVLMELHPADHQALHLAFGGSAAVKVERGDAFELFVEAYLRLTTVWQVEVLWVVGQVPLDVRQALNLPADAKGIDGVFKTRSGLLVPYQVKHRIGRPKVGVAEVATFLGLTERATDRVLNRTGFLGGPIP